MRRLTVPQRHRWREKFEEIGFTFHSLDGIYWNEGVCYEFTGEEIDRIERITAELDEMCLEAAGYVIAKNLFPKIGIPDSYAGYIKNSWERDDRSLYGRFDFSFDGQGDLKLLEYNADTPTSLLEAGVAQWVWLEEAFPRFDQFNSIHEKLLGAFKEIHDEMPSGKPFYFSCVQDHEEDFATVEYLRDAALQASLDARHIFIEEIGFSEETGLFYDSEGRPVELMFKLYPWEWLIRDEFGERILPGKIQFFEPPWKMILSNKGILPILWQLYPGHPNLLPSFFEPSKLKGNYIRKPIFSREGASIAVYEQGISQCETGGTYGAEGFIYQETRPLPCFDGNYAVVGSWIVNGWPAGIGIREDDSPITKNTSRFVPHFFKP